MNKEKEYIAFISYSRKDIKVAEWLHSNLEKYKYPVKLVKAENEPPDGKYLRPVFMDIKDLKMTEREFSQDLKDALINSKYLILLCSKNSAQSIFVKQEIEFFLDHHDKDYKRIVPLFIDQVEDSIPEPILDSPVMSRHFPVFSTSLRFNSDPNIACLYQVISYILGLDFAVIYDRYEHYESKRKKRIYCNIIALICILVIFFIQAVFTIYRKESAIEFEKKVYPQSIVYGYCENFLNPLIDYLKENEPNTRIGILLPINNREIENHQRRLADIKIEIARSLSADSLELVTLPTSMRRGTRVFKVVDKNNHFQNIIIDFATTTSSFKKVAAYKMEHPDYSGQELDDLIKEYSETFMQQTKEELKSDSTYINFFTDREQFIDWILSTRQ